MIQPDYIFETSWEVCNKVGGIYTVISTKALNIVNKLGDKYILIGPDVWKETHQNPDFIEDKQLFQGWREQAASEGLRIRTGRWNIAGTPLVVLVDFTPFFSQKDKIFARFWESYHLDSLTGGWDYIEPALFGYTAAKVIESYYEFFLSSEDKLIAHFHEWMTGTGALYLKSNVPQAATVFTTHATALGRSIAGNGLPLYSKLEEYDPQILSNNFGIRSKYSLERLSATEADAFTTVSEVTARECKYLLKKEVDEVTPNGFEDSFVPVGDDFDSRRREARTKIFEVLEKLIDEKLDINTPLIINSGRYEYGNKGIDAFIKALGKLNKSNKLNQNLIAIIAVPAHHTGPNPGLLSKLNDANITEPLSNRFTTHSLFDNTHDAVMSEIRNNGLNNEKNDQVKVFFVPSYLNGDDGIFNLLYYDFLIGFDLSVFPSYYEPWGYTPLESLAFYIPTITTSLAGFGQWVNEKLGPNYDGIRVIERTDDNFEDTVDQIASGIGDFVNLSNERIAKERKLAYDVSRIALWDNLVEHYFKAYHVALSKADERSELYQLKVHPEQPYSLTSFKPEQPEWRKILIEPALPEGLEKLYELTRNLWWSWNPAAIELFRSIDPVLWEESRRNPIVLMDNLSIEQFNAMKRNKKFMDQLESIYNTFNEYMQEAGSKPTDSIAYLSMEYGLHDSLKIYSGGLGMLAGDFMKQASDSNINITGIGLLYRYGYFHQSISYFGDQNSIYHPQKFTQLPLIPVRDEDDDWIQIRIALPGRIVTAKVWRVDVGRVPLYLLDTDIPENSAEDRSITHQLYGGDHENRLKQELLLGVGGIRLLDAIGHSPDIYHCNEGHAAFSGLERLRKLVQEENTSFDVALEIVRSSSLFTTHTPVPAGHDAFSEDLLRTYIPHYADRLQISWNKFMGLGRFNEKDPYEKFSLSVLAAKLSQEMNGVSKIHGKVSREMFKGLFEGYFADELHISHVTNGVHYATWTSPDWQDLHKEAFGDGFYNNQSQQDLWKKIHDISDDVIWKTKQNQKKQLLEYLDKRVINDLTLRQEKPKYILQVKESFESDILTIGFARRFATYKRAHLLFTNIERLAAIVNNEKYPVRFLFAGKAHPNDKAGQDLIKQIIEISKREEFIGKILFIENYDMELAKKLISGVDVWLNTPTRPLEASGTSGEKAVMNGVVNLSVLDGWWAEGYKERAGFAISEARTYANQIFQDELDAETIYEIIEEEIAPVFYNRNKNSVPAEWVQYIKNTFSEIAPHFTMKRMLDDYYNKFYTVLFNRKQMMSQNNYSLAHKMAEWKNDVYSKWYDIEILSVKVPDPTVRPLTIGQSFKAEIELDLKGLSPEDIGIELLLGQKENDSVNEVLYFKELEFTMLNGDKVTYKTDLQLEKSGVYDYIFRMYARHPMLPHRQDVNLVRLI